MACTHAYVTEAALRDPQGRRLFRIRDEHMTVHCGMGVTQEVGGGGVGARIGGVGGDVYKKCASREGGRRATPQAPDGLSGVWVGSLALTVWCACGLQAVGVVCLPIRVSDTVTTIVSTTSSADIRGFNSTALSTNRISRWVLAHGG